jgi:hypothetical protein
MTEGHRQGMSFIRIVGSPADYFVAVDNKTEVLEVKAFGQGGGLSEVPTFFKYPGEHMTF